MKEPPLRLDRTFCLYALFLTAFVLVMLVWLTWPRPELYARYSPIEWLIHGALAAFVLYTLWRICLGWVAVLTLKITEDGASQRWGFSRVSIRWTDVERFGRFRPEGPLEVVSGDTTVRIVDAYYQEPEEVYRFVKGLIACSTNAR